MQGANEMPRKKSEIIHTISASDRSMNLFIKRLGFCMGFLLVGCLSKTIGNPLVYAPDQGSSRGKNIVLIASDHEYRSEETLPALARILARHHGFHCTVLFGLNKNGEIEAGASHIPATSTLDKADGLVLFTRFQNLPEEQMAPIAAYLDRAGPVVGMRTATHGFKIPAGAAYAKYSFNYKGEEERGGFGEQILGQSWVGHYGQNHRQSTRIESIQEQSEHPILRGVRNVHVKAGGYNAEPQPDWTVLTMAQPLMSMEPDGKPDTSKPPMASEWTRTYAGADGQSGRVFTSLYGASEDILNPGYRRLVINGIYWSLGLENEIKADSVIDFVGPYQPNTFQGGGHARGIKPSAYEGFESPIPVTNGSAAAQPSQKQPAEKKDAAAAGVQARYVRIELPGDWRTLTLAEVEVFSEGKNIAPAGTASQSTTGYGAGAKRAIDGNSRPTWGSGGLTHTVDNRENPWWELDLGGDFAVSSVEVWNRGDANLGSRLDGFTLQLFDSERREVFEREGITAPRSSVHIRTTGGIITYLEADGKPGKAPDWKAAASQTQGSGTHGRVEVPGAHRDPTPFAFQKGDVVASIGNALGERFQHRGGLEVPIQDILPDHDLTFRNLCVSGDKVGKFPRSKGFTSMDTYLRHVGADVIFCFFGYNESHDDTPDHHTKRLVDYVRELRSYKPNGESMPRIVLFSPIAHENLKDPNLPNGMANNLRLARYTEATRTAAEQAGVAFVDLFSASRKLYRDNDVPLTINGVHLNELGNTLLGYQIAEELTGQKPSGDPSMAHIRTAVEDKNWHWFNRYRATDGNDIWGGRSGLKYVGGQTNADVLQHELNMLDVYTANRDKVIWDVTGKDGHSRPATSNDENVPAPIPVISNVGGGSNTSSAEKEGSLNYLSGEEGIAKMHIPEGFKVELFADEAMFPEVVNPVQMQVDTKGRLWAAAWHTYPMWEPGTEMKDALIILEDVDGDGRADSCKEFARVHNPVGFEFWNGGVLVTSAPDLIFLKDTDGDDVADVRYVIQGGFGSADTHHNANNLVYGPDGGIYWQSGIFLQHNHEHPWGRSLNTGAAGMFRFDPRRFTIAYHAGGTGPNPHGISFDGWGYHYANDGTGGRSYQLRPFQTRFHPHSLLNREFRPVTADAIISSPNFPDRMQGDFIIANTITYRGLKTYSLHRDGYSKEVAQQKRNKETGKKETFKVTRKFKVGEVWGTPDVEILRSDDGNFRPTDAVFGADGALYISDWCNVIIGHLQHSVRDPNRDKKHGRIYRMTYPSRPLQEPVAIDGQPLDALMVNLEHPVDGVRHRTRVELSERSSDDVVTAAREWIKKWDPNNPDHARNLLEGLWVHQQHNVRDRNLLATVLASPVEHARIAAATVKHHWGVADPARGQQEIIEEEEMEVEPGGIVSDTSELTIIRVNTVVEQLRFDVKEVEVKAGKKVRLIFVNPDALPHNLVLVKPGKADTVATAAIMLGADGFAKQFIPESEDILHYTALLDGGEEEELEFDAPTEPGDYQFVCTFPGHAFLMRGILRVK